MRTPTDALRSLKKYVASSLGPEWEVRFTGEEGAFSRPFARVGAVSSARTVARGALTFDMSQPFSVVCHPKETETPDEARMEAARVQMLLVAAFSIGTHKPSYHVVGSRVVAGHAVNISRAHPLRVPLYDYSSVPLGGAATELNRNARDFMRVSEDPTVEVIADPNDDLRFAVAAAATMSWAISAAVLSDAMTVQNVTLDEEGN